MTESDAVKMANFRFSTINSLLIDSHLSLKERFQELAQREWMLPSGLTRMYAAATFEDWYYDYKKFGFEALKSPSRKDKNTQRSIPEVVANEIDLILKEYPDMKSSTIILLLNDRGLRPDGKPSQATLYRYLKKIRVDKSSSIPQRRAFEAPHPASLYQTDLMYGPDLKLRGKDGRIRTEKTYLIAIIDDYSRVICAGQFFCDQGLMSYLTVLENAFRSRGIPDRIYCDNGQIFISSQVQRIGAELGTKIVRTKVRDAAAKGKIERFFKTVRDQFLDHDLRLEEKKLKDIEDLNRLFRKYLQKYNSRQHSAIGCSPLERWLRSPHQPRFPKDTLDIETLFMLEEERTIKKDGTISVRKILFELYSANAGQKARIRYNPQDLTKLYAFLDDEYLGVFYPLNRQANDGVPRNRKEV